MTDKTKQFLKDLAELMRKYDASLDIEVEAGNYDRMAETSIDINVKDGCQDNFVQIADGITRRCDILPMDLLRLIED